MKTVVLASAVTYGNRLGREIAADPTLGPNYEYIVALKGTTTIYFKDAFTSADETYLHGTFMPAFVDEDNDADYQPKILDLISNEVHVSDHRDINYNTSLQTTMFQKVTMVKGEVTHVDWYSDEALTDLVLKVDITYYRDSNGFAIYRETTRTWVNRNGTDNVETKYTKKRYDINLQDQIQEGIIRRGNIVNALQIPTLGFMVETISGMSVPEILLMGREFLDRFEEEFSKFIQNSSTVTDPMDPDFGKKNVAVAFENAPDTWLDNQPAALGGATIRQWLVSEVTI